jgi:hypothetical protein
MYIIFNKKLWEELIDRVGKLLLAFASRVMDSLTYSISRFSEELIVYYLSLHIEFLIRNGWHRKYRVKRFF